MPGFWSNLLRGEKAVPALPFDTYDPAQRVLPDPYEPWMGVGGPWTFVSDARIPVADPGVPLDQLRAGNPGLFWAGQPNVRKVVDFIARNVASIPLRAYERIADADRRRLGDHQLSRMLAKPQPGVSPFRFWRGVLSDGLIYDRWAVLTVANDDDGLDLIHIPSRLLHLEIDGLNRVVGASYWTGKVEDQREELPLEDLIFDHGYAPATAGLSPIVTLQEILREGLESVRWRHQVWENGARVPVWIERPAGAEWSDEARERFKAGFREAYTGDGENAGGAPLMEDGMKLHELEHAFSPTDAQDLEGRRLSAIEVAAAFHIAPELVGAREGTYSNVDAFRQMLYRDSLGPYITAWEGAINAQLVERLEPGSDIYVEAHVESKLRGSFEEQAKVKQSATGAPWLTRNEARALENRPPVAGGDDLVTPLNVLTGGQASPNDAGSQNRLLNAPEPSGKGVTHPDPFETLHKAQGPREQHEKRVTQVLEDFFRRQGAAVLKRIRAGGAWWDADRWDGELADDLFRAAHTLAGMLGEAEAKRLGYEGGYDPDATVEFLRTAARRRAERINETTKDQLDAAIEDPDADPAEVYTTAEGSRAAGIAVGVTTFLAGFTLAEVGKQLVRTEGVRATKTWHTTSGNPRSTHAAMDGETVPVDELFSNGMNYPGDDDDPDEVAGCQCTVTVTVERRE